MVVPPTHPEKIGFLMSANTIKSTVQIIYHVMIRSIFPSIIGFIIVASVAQEGNFEMFLGAYFGCVIGLLVYMLWDFIGFNHEQLKDTGYGFFIWVMLAYPCKIFSFWILDILSLNDFLADSFDFYFAYVLSVTCFPFTDNFVWRTIGRS